MWEVTSLVEHTGPEGATLVGSLVELIESATSLEGNEVNTIAYYATATHGLPDLHIFPILAIYGPGGTGKTTLLEILRELVLNPRWMEGTEATRAVNRDQFKENTTALIDEADGFPEQLLIKRYSRTSSALRRS